MLDAGSYGQVFKQNRRIANRYWIVLAHRRNEEPARMGLAVAKKRAKRALDRNRIKRIARESFRHARVNLSGFDVVVMNKDQARSASRQDLRQSLDALWFELSGINHQRNQS